jgi:predicted Zn-ribbon and HTH transcriptional regulator
LLCAVAVHHATNGQHKTIFRVPEEGFKTSVFVAKLIALIKKEDREGVLSTLEHLAELLQKNQTQLEEAPNKAQRGDAVVFPSDVFHAGAAPVVAENATAEEGPRVTSYLQFVPTVVVQNAEWWPLLETLYDSEHVFDRRTMVSPLQLAHLMTLHGEDPLVVEHAEHWLKELRKGRVNCIQS